MTPAEVDALLARLDGPHGSGLLDRLDGARRMLEAQRPVSTWTTACIDADAAKWIREAAALIREQASELAALRHDLSQYQVRDAERETRIAELERAWSRKNGKDKTTGLRRCPFCGGKAEHAIGSAKPQAHYVMCTNAECNATTAMREFAADATQDWNRRYDTKGNDELLRADRDAARYRWLRQFDPLGMFVVQPDPFLGDTMLCEEFLDAAIDDAMQEQK